MPDTRDQHEFAVGHLAGSINVGLEGRYAEYAGGVVQPGVPIGLITDDGLEVEAKNRLARIGFDRGPSATSPSRCAVSRSIRRRSSAARGSTSVSSSSGWRPTTTCN